VPAIEGSSEEVLRRVQEVINEHTPGVVCELQDYETQVGCGALDERGSLQEVQWRVRGLTEYSVECGAKALASRLARRTTFTGRNQLSGR
jgi:hypothetical protein